MRIFFLMMLFALEAGAADALIATSKFGTLHPDEVASTSEAITKLGAIIRAYRCEEAGESTKDERCAAAEAAREAVKKIGVKNIDFQGIHYALVTEGENLTAGVYAIGKFIAENQPVFHGRDPKDVILEVGPTLMYAQSR